MARGLLPARVEQPPRQFPAAARRASRPQQTWCTNRAQSCPRKDASVVTGSSSHDNAAVTASVGGGPAQGMFPISGRSHNTVDVPIFQMKTQGLSEVSQLGKESDATAPFLTPTSPAVTRSRSPNRWFWPPAPSSGRRRPALPWLPAPATTLVEVGQCLLVQLHGRGRGSAQHVLQGRQAGLVLRGQLGLLLLEDGQSEHIPANTEGALRSGAGGPCRRRAGGAGAPQSPGRRCPGRPASRPRGPAPPGAQPSPRGSATPQGIWSIKSLMR